MGDLQIVPAANKNGYFSTELVEMELKTKKGKEVFSQDEHPRETTIDKLAKLKPVFKEDGLVTAGNASVRNLHTPTHYYCLRPIAEEYV